MAVIYTSTREITLSTHFVSVLDLINFCWGSRVGGPGDGISLGLGLVSRLGLAVDIRRNRVSAIGPMGRYRP